MSFEKTSFSQLECTSIFVIAARDISIFVPDCLEQASGLINDAFKRALAGSSFARQVGTCPRDISVDSIILKCTWLGV